MTNPPPPYGHPPYPPQYPQRPPKKSNTALWVLLGVFGGIALLCGGCALIVGGSIDSASDVKSTTVSTAWPTLPAPTGPAAPRTTAPQAAPSPSQAFTESEIADLSYLLVLDQQKVPYSSREAAITLARSVCDARAAGNTVTAIALRIAAEGYTPQQSGTIVGAAQAAYCPQFR